MGKRYLIDTNTVIDYMAEKLPQEGLNFMDKIIDESPIISFITQIELLGQSKVKTDKFVPFIQAAMIIGINENIVKRTIAIRKSKSIKIPDAIIAATAIENDLVLITHNVSDFNKLQNLMLLDLYAPLKGAL